MEKEVIIKGMKCEGCANTVQIKLSEIEGVKAIEVNRENSKAKINSEYEISNSDLQTALEDTNYKIIG